VRWSSTERILELSYSQCSYLYTADCVHRHRLEPGICDSLQATIIVSEELYRFSFSGNDPLQPSSLAPGTNDTGPRELLPYPGISPHTGMSPPDRFPGEAGGYANHSENYSWIRCIPLPCDLIRYADVS
jgi:hypothetical protein